MNKKTILKLGALLIAGAIVGALLTLALDASSPLITGELAQNLSLAFTNYSLYIIIIIVLSLMIPTFYYFTKGKSLMNETLSLEDEDLDQAEKKAQKYSNKGVAYNGILMATNFMLYGMTFDVDAPFFLTKTLIFLFVSISCSTIEILTVKLMQKFDDRLKGDPTSLSFQKDFIKSCDEAEKLKIYESAFKAFQFVKNGSLVMLIITILLKVTNFTGSFPVFVSSAIFLMIIASHNYYAIKADQ